MLAAAGARVVVAARTAGDVDAVADELRRSGADAWAAVCDVSAPESVRELATEARDRLEHVDVLVNAAGVAHAAALERIALDDWQRLIAVNATGTLLCMQAFVPAMVEQGWGRVVNVASVAGLQGGRYIAAYAASKHAVIGLTRSVAAEVAGRGVVVNAVCPAYVDTAMTRESVRRIQARTGRSAEEALAALLETSGQSRLIEADEVARLVLSLCAEDAAAINGQAVVVEARESHAEAET